MFDSNDISAIIAVSLISQVSRTYKIQKKENCVTNFPTPKSNARYCQQGGAGASESELPYSPPARGVSWRAKKTPPAMGGVGWGLLCEN